MPLMRMRVFMYSYSSAAPLLDLRIEAVMDVLDTMVRDGFSLARSVELTAQWDETPRAAPDNPTRIFSWLGAVVSVCVDVLLEIFVYVMIHLFIPTSAQA